MKKIFLLKNKNVNNALLSFAPYADTLLYVEIVFIAFGVSFFFGKPVSAFVSGWIFLCVTGLVIMNYYSLKPARVFQLAVFDVHLPYQLAQILAILVYNEITLIYAAVLAFRVPFSLYELACIILLTDENISVDTKNKKQPK